jgi:hypothetical protein
VLKAIEFVASSAATWLMLRSDAAREHAMTFSSAKAKEIYDRMRIGGKINYSIGRAEKNYMTEKAQDQPGPQWNYDGLGLREELKRQWGRSVNHAEDKDWDEIAKWLFDLATLAKK